MEKEFTIKINFAVFVFLIAYTGYAIFLLLLNNIKDFIPICTVGLVLYMVFLGLRPYRYVVDRKTITIKYRLRKNKEIDLMECETICDPVPRFSEMYNRPHAIEIYTTKRKRYCFFPKDRVGFVEAVVRGNKRMHCTVQDYTDFHRQLGKKLRKEKRKAERKAAQEKESK